MTSCLLVSLSVMSYAQSNVSTLNQIGVGQEAAINQKGSGLNAAINQTGDRNAHNYGVVTQSGGPQTATINQIGGTINSYVSIRQAGEAASDQSSANTATVTQSGLATAWDIWSNTWVHEPYRTKEEALRGPGGVVDVVQSGKSNSITISQFGRETVTSPITVEQIGNGNVGDITQTSIADHFYGRGNNSVYLGQTGDNNTAALTQVVGGGDNIYVTQVGNNNSGTVSQSGERLSATITQTGNDNSATVNQTPADGATTSITQTGDRLSATVTQNSDNVAVIDQRNSGVEGSSVVVLQNGNRNLTNVIQGTDERSVDNAVANVTQTGDDNSIKLSQTGYRQGAKISQTGNGNRLLGVEGETSFASQSGTYNTLTLTQNSETSGIGNQAFVNQQGDANAATITQRAQ
ncbi:Curlin associated repeat-containing protein [Spirosoma fluviale]|uniref:Curlin associated repeat-containing protein n=2 Tax=Spirosoma fluviale TaxID=1597977 RepID=A0A286G023_9BACT|nr:Curlin associated repeat-containing protein [Spirosoma fluviale]